MNASQPPFLKLARKPDINQETAFTICRMINSVGSNIVKNWDWDWLKGENRDYQELINHSWLEDAWKLLSEKDWYSQQTTNNTDKKISNIEPLEGMTKLQTLVLQNNLVSDLRPLAGMKKLKSLSLYSNRITDLSVLQKLQDLEELTLAHNPIESFRSLESLPRLRELTLSPDQVARFGECGRLASLRVLKIEGDDQVADFTLLPEMPGLKSLDVHDFRFLRGIERFSQLESLKVWGGNFSALDEIAKLRALTHLCLTSSERVDVKPLTQLHALRRLSLGCPKVLGLPCLKALPVLREVELHDEDSCDAIVLAALQSEIGSWDDEFKTDSKGVDPSFEIVVVDQAAFDHYDSKAAFGLLPGEETEAMLQSERNWLVEQLREALSIRFTDEEDFHLPFTCGFQRTERVIIYSVEAYEALRDVISSVQRVLGETRNDWIIWCQSLLGESPEEQEIPDDAEDFIVWVYPNKIVVTEEHAETVRKLIEWNK